MTSRKGLLSGPPVPSCKPEQEKGGKRTVEDCHGTKRSFLEYSEEQPASRCPTRREPAGAAAFSGGGAVAARHGGVRIRRRAALRLFPDEQHRVAPLRA